MTNNFGDLSLPQRPHKPREEGRTHVIDTGAGVAWLDDILQSIDEIVDLAKLGWGTSVVTSNLNEKLAIYDRHDIEVCFGGTLFEIAYLQRRIDEYSEWLSTLGVATIEVSDGTLVIDRAEKTRLIEKLAHRFSVFSEVGSKDSDAVVSPARWVEQIRDELSAGARKVILEGRESGTAGLYRPSGEIRMGLIEEIVDAGIDLEDLVFEAPVKAQQVWLLNQLGSDVNLANVHLQDALAVETLRLGLRADTMLSVHSSE